jgi:hypothetical protein
MRSSVDDFKFRVIVAVFLGIILLSCVFLVSIGYGINKGYKEGYIQALNDIRLGKTPKYKLVQVAEKWVEVEK